MPSYLLIKTYLKVTLWKTFAIVRYANHVRFSMNQIFRSMETNVLMRSTVLCRNYVQIWTASKIYKNVHHTKDIPFSYNKRWV